MLSVLLKQYRQWCQAQPSTDGLMSIVRHEHGQLSKPDYLVSDVIGKAEFDWDFRCLDEGFLELVNLYLQQTSGASALFLSALHEQQVDARSSEQAVLFVEFGHSATLINDHYSFHPDLNIDSPSPERASKLTQFRYAGQFLSNYPRYLLVTNRLALPDQQQNELHKAIASVAVTQGMSRGVMLKWIDRRFQGVTQDQYFQNAINSISSHIAFPVILSMILAGTERTTINQVRKPLGHLALAVKLSLERESLFRPGPDALAHAAQATATILSFPGLPLAQGSHTLEAATGATNIYDLYEAAQELLQTDRNQVAEAYEHKINSSLDDFRRELERLDMLRIWSAGLAAALAISRQA